MANDLTLFDANGRELKSPSVELEQRTNFDEIVSSFMRGVPMTGAPVVTERNAYQKQVWVFACVTAIARLVASIPIEIRNISSGKPVKEGLVPDLFLRRPAIRRSRYELIFTTLAHLELSGNALWLMDQSLGDDQPPFSLKPLNPRRTIPVRRPHSLDVIGYMYMPDPNNDSLKIPLRLDEVIHFKYPNPEDDGWGQSPLEAGMFAVRTDVKAAAYNEKFFDNSAQPGGILLHKRPLTTPQREQIATQFEEEYGGVNQSHRTAVLAGEWSYQQVGLNQRDMDYLNQRQFSREQIGAVFGVPGILINDPNRSNYSTASIEMRLFADSNWVPKVKYIEDVMRSQFFRRFAPELEMRFQTAEAPGLREATSERIGQMIDLNKAGVPMADLIRHFEMPWKIYPHMKHWWIPISMVPADPESAASLQEIKTDKTILGQGEGGRPAEGAKSDGGKLPGTKDSDTATPPEDKKPKAVAAVGGGRAAYVDNRRAVYWRSYDRLLQSYISIAERKVSRAFFESRQRVLGNTLLTGNSAGDFYNVDYEVEELQKLLGPIVGDVLERAGQMVFDELQLEREFLLHEDVPPEQYSAALEGLSQIPETIKPVLNHAVEAGEVRRVFDLLGSKSKLIARAELSRSVNRGRMIAMRLAGIDQHQWIAARAARGVGCGHLNDGEVRQIGEPFSNGMVHPAEVAVNGGCCGCITLPMP